MAVFYCTSCASEEYIIPKMLKMPLKDADIPKGFLNSYQVNFRVLVFKTKGCEIREEYIEKIKFNNWKLIPSRNQKVKSTKIEGIPNWLLGNQSPKSYAGNDYVLSDATLVCDFEFETLDGAPLQRNDFPSLGCNIFLQAF